MRSDDVLAGPRGRRLCSALAQVFRVGGDEAAVRSAVARCLDEVLHGPAAEAAIYEALTHSVDCARYYQDPDADDLALADPATAALFEPIAAAVAEHPCTLWWTSPLDPAAQVYSLDEVGGRPAPFGRGTAEDLRAWHDETVAYDERMRRARVEGGEQVWAMTSGTWWTPPIFAAPATARVDPRFGPVGLSLVEDSRGHDEARSWPVTAPDGPRVLEVDSVDAWAELVARYPIGVTHARGANWLQATGRDGAWAIPDWPAVTADFDAVHLTVAGYLAASGTVIEVGDGVASFIAAWGPDTTYWLTELAIDEHEVTRWVRREDDVGWERTG